MAQRIIEPGADQVLSEQFADGDHQRRFLIALALLDSEQIQSGEWVGAVYLMTITDALWTRMQRAAHWKERLVYWPHRAGTLSAGEIVIERLAEEVYSGGGCNLGVSDICSTLSDAWFEAVLTGLRIRRYGPDVIDWEALRESLSPRPNPTP